jgi:hypothetical protein
MPIPWGEKLSWSMPFFRFCALTFLIDNFPDMGTAWTNAKFFRVEKNKLCCKIIHAITDMKIGFKHLALLLTVIICAIEVINNCVYCLAFNCY